MKDLWKRLTTTVGLVTTRRDEGVNVMAAEWTYFLNKDPLYVGVALSRRSITRDLIRRNGEFSVTLCSDSQAGLADFAGSFSGADIDKSSSEGLVLCAPHVTSVPWVPGGVAAFECVVRQLIELPDYDLYVGESLAAHIGDSGVRPLVKHGPMHTLGERAERDQAVAAAQLIDGGDRPEQLRVAATGPAPEPQSPWQLTLIADGDVTYLGAHAPDRFGDLMVDIELDRPLPGEPSSWRVRAERDGLKPGWARVSRRAAPWAD